MIEPWNWKLENLVSLIGEPESLRLEFKSSELFVKSPHDIASNLSQVVSAFANTEGGTIVIGIKEAQKGKYRTASILDSGLDIRIWSPERIQQIIASCISPTLPNFRVKPIKLAGSGEQHAFVIFVPQGTTAYQANDFKYYGRWEFECKPLPDHDVRLRMFRSQLPLGIISASLVEAIPIQRVRQEWLFSKNTKIQSYIEQFALSDVVELKYVEVLVFLENTGQINITEYSVELHLDTEGFDALQDDTITVKDGWYEEQRIYTAATRNLEPHFVPMRVNIFPSQTQALKRYGFHVPSNFDFSECEFVLEWKIYLKDSIPIQGTTKIKDIISAISAESK